MVVLCVVCRVVCVVFRLVLWVRVWLISVFSVGELKIFYYCVGIFCLVMKCWLLRVVVVFIFLVV